MRIALLYDPWLLSARGTLDLHGYRDDPRGMTGSEQCAVRLYEELSAMGHEVWPFWPGNGGAQPWAERADGSFDLAISINCPDGLRDVRAKYKCCYALLNDWTFAKVGFEQHVDLFASPSAPHLEQVMTNPAWRLVDTFECREGRGRYEPDPTKWCVVPLGCDPERYQPYCPNPTCGGGKPYVRADRRDTGQLSCDACGLYMVNGRGKVPGRVVYCSSPDRGLHWLLQEWPHIKRAVPHAHLRIFYRLQKWIDDLKRAQQPDGSIFESVKPLWQRAVYIEEALRRMSDPKWGIEVRDSVSRATIEREMAEAEVLAYSCQTTAWSEGFSVTTLEACAGRACPVITDCDALGEVYADAAAILPVGNWEEWRATVIRALTDSAFRDTQNERAHAFALRHTWRNTAEQLMARITERICKGQ
jgi:glycosyltransferase involved in cell wall biosynthesis